MSDIIQLKSETLRALQKRKIGIFVRERTCEILSGGKANQELRAEHGKAMIALINEPRV
jgi:hypothetical protein